ncbi:hypothetical protein [Glycomyces arizonensis]|uniref:hypothetical protein n=1 Tax=Glycomyces arizonensis TaxID=256035 RepID=UPI00041251B6|nr:hypothetical protein [Glycomyces arizonensis]
MPVPQTPEELEQALYELAVNIHELKALETAIDAWNPLSAAAAAVGTGLPFKAYYEAAMEKEGAVISSEDSPDLGGIPDFCRNVYSIDAEQFSGAAEILDVVALDMVDLEGAPGNVLNKIGDWYGDAAESFEEYFSGYRPAQLRQAEMFAAADNACASLKAMASAAKDSAGNLIDGALTLTAEMIKVYWEQQEAMQDTITIGVLSLVAAGLSAGASAGALAIAGALGGGVTGLAGSMYSFQLTEKQLTAKNVSSLLRNLGTRFGEVETALREADDEIYAAIDAVRSEWPMRKVAIPVPPGADEINTESFHHESSL